MRPEGLRPDPAHLPQVCRRCDTAHTTPAGWAALRVMVEAEQDPITAEWVQWRHCHCGEALRVPMLSAAERLADVRAILAHLDTVRRAAERLRAHASGCGCGCGRRDLELATELEEWATT